MWGAPAGAQTIRPAAAVPPTPPANANGERVLKGQFTLARYDMPLRSNGFAPTRQPARRKPGPDAVDWPDITLDGRPLFRGEVGRETDVALPIRTGRESMPLFRQSYDHVIEPGGHWLRAMDWRFNRRHIYTADLAARTSNAGESYTAQHYELWTFPVRIAGKGAADVKAVEVRYGGKTVYQKAGPWRSLTLLLPQNERGVPYKISVNGRPAQSVAVGLAPPLLGDPREELLPVALTFPGGRTKITAENLSRPGEFPNPKEWAEDMASLGQPTAADPQLGERAPWAARVGGAVPRSPVTVYADCMPHGMSAGFWRNTMHGVSGFAGTPEEYAGHLADLGFDTVFDSVRSLPEPDAPDAFERRAEALARRGIRFGLHYDNNWNSPALQHPNVAFFSHNLPDWHAPLYRSLQLAIQRFQRYPNFTGLITGSDNAAYVSYWDWAAPIPDRPWGQALTQFLSSETPRVPIAPSLKTVAGPHETLAPDQATFAGYLARYDETFKQYGYFARAVREVNPSLVYTTGSFGSSPGGGGSGGWPWASVPGREMHEGLSVQQVYDWNEKTASPPLLNVALVDRLRSYYPDKTTWSLLDDFKLHLNKMTRQRAHALALTRGVRGVGTTFLPNPTGEAARPDLKEMNAWVHRYGGVYALTEPEASVGVLYVHRQSLMRRDVRGDAPLAQRLTGSHEGKTTEALFLCHAAGWPARIVTPEEIERGLPLGMKALLLVGLNEFDQSWTWHQGLVKSLGRFVAGGGRVLLDDESVSPVSGGVATGLKVAAYVSQSSQDRTSFLIERNQDNTTKLRTAMAGIAPPVAASTDPTLWAVPTRVGDTSYVTAVNQAMRDEGPSAAGTADGAAAREMAPRMGTLAWNTKRPIYDVRLGRRVTAQVAATVDLTQNAFQWYALPPAPVTTPTVVVTAGADGFYRAAVTVANPKPMTGIPVEVTVSRGGETATVYGASETAVKLPLRADDPPGAYSVTATELLSGLRGNVVLWVTPRATLAAAADTQMAAAAALMRFAGRKTVPLTVALTPEQARDPAVRALAERLAVYFRGLGRTTSLSRVEPNGVVVSVQPYSTPARYPRWKTVDTDLVLLGAPADNVLVLDQARGWLLPPTARALPPGRGSFCVTYSPFVGERQVLNLLASDTAGLSAAVGSVTAGK